MCIMRAACQRADVQGVPRHGSLARAAGVPVCRHVHSHRGVSASLPTASRHSELPAPISRNNPVCGSGLHPSGFLHCQGLFNMALLVCCCYSPINATQPVGTTCCFCAEVSPHCHYADATVKPLQQDLLHSSCLMTTWHVPQASVGALLTHTPALPPAAAAAAMPASAAQDGPQASKSTVTGVLGGARLPLSEGHVQRLQASLARTLRRGPGEATCQVAAACVLACLAGEPSREVLEQAGECLQAVARCSWSPGWSISGALTEIRETGFLGTCGGTQPLLCHLDSRQGVAVKPSREVWSRQGSACRLLPGAPYVGRTCAFGGSPEDLVVKNLAPGLALG